MSVPSLLSAPDAVPPSRITACTEAVPLPPLSTSPFTHRSEFLTDRRSTRVHAAPGGQQQFNIFGGPTEAPVAPAAKTVVAPTVTAASEAPIAGQRVVQRSEHHGISTEGHMSTRVHAAPGGQQQFNIFSGAAEQPRTSAPVRAPVSQLTLSAGVAMPAAGQRVEVRTEHHGISSVPSTFVHAAPGGASNMASLVGGTTASDRIAAMKALRNAAPPLAEATNTGGA